VGGVLRGVLPAVLEPALVLLFCRLFSFCVVLVGLSVRWSLGRGFFFLRGFRFPLLFSGRAVVSALRRQQAPLLIFCRDIEKYKIRSKFIWYVDLS